MWHSKRTIYSIAVTDYIVAVLIVTSIAEVCRAKAVEESHRAAEVAFPVNLLRSVLLTHFLASSVCLHLALLAAKILSFRLVLHVQLLLAINETTKVGLFAVITLVKRA